MLPAILFLAWLAWVPPQGVARGVALNLAGVGASPPPPVHIDILVARTAWGAQFSREHTPSSIISVAVKLWRLCCTVTGGGGVMGRGGEVSSFKEEEARSVSFGANACWRQYLYYSYY